MQAAISWRGSRGAARRRWRPSATLLPLLLLLGLPQGRPAAPPRALLGPRRVPQPLPPPPAPSEEEEAEQEAQELEEEEDEDGVEGGKLAAVIKRQFDDYGHMRFGKRTWPRTFSQRRIALPSTQQRVRKFDDYGHMRFGRSEGK